MMSNIFLFGGSFNPPHNGHVEFVKYILNEYSGIKIMIVPAVSPPHKDPSEIISYLHRFRMTRISFGDILNDDSGLMLSALERHLSGFTRDNINFIEEKCGKKPGLIIGADMYNDLPNWKNGIEIAENINLITALRSDNNIRKIYKNSDIFLKNSRWDISSTLLRDAILEKDEVVLKKWLHPSVYAYIADNHLYGY